MDGTSLRVYGLNSLFRPLWVLNTDKRRSHTQLQGNMAQAVVSVALRPQGFSSRAGRSGSVPGSGGLALLRPAVHAGLKSWDAPRCAADGAMPMRVQTSALRARIRAWRARGIIEERFVPRRIGKAVVEARCRNASIPARHAVARGFGWLKGGRRVAIRYAPYAHCCLDFPYLAGTWI